MEECKLKIDTVALMALFEKPKRENPSLVCRSRLNDEYWLEKHEEN